MVTLASRGNVLVATMGRNFQNTIDDAFAGELEYALDESERLGSAVLHLRTATPHFCGGADPARVAQWMGDRGAEALRGDGERWNRLFRRIEVSPTITFAEVRGNALGAGLGLVLACDLRMISASARLGVPEVKVGLLPAGRTIERLVGMAGTVVAQRLLLGGDLVNGVEAHRMGLAHWISPDEGLQERSFATSERIAGQSPAALRQAKRLLAAVHRRGSLNAADVEVAAFDHLIQDRDARKRISALLDRISRREATSQK